MIHLYYGNGKGKTTAAIGLAIRALGAGLPVVFSQFKKSRETGELRILRDLTAREPLLLLRPERQYPFYRDMSEEEKCSITAEHNRILDQIAVFLDAHSAEKETAPLVVLDEMTWALSYHLMDEPAALRLLRSGSAEFVVTGRTPAEALKEMADYATEMCAVRHPYDAGVPARRGIEF